MNFVAPRRVVAVPVSRDRLRYVIHNMRERDQKELYALQFSDDPDTFLDIQMLIMGPMCRIWERNGVPVSVHGAICAWPGVWSVFAYGTDDWPKVLPAMVRWQWHFVFPALDKVAHRVEFRVLATHTDSRRLIESFGAWEECVLSEYGRNREDFVLYVWKPEHVPGRRRR